MTLIMQRQHDYIQMFTFSKRTFINVRIIYKTILRVISVILNMYVNIYNYFFFILFLYFILII